MSHRMAMLLSLALCSLLLTAPAIELVLQSGHAGEVKAVAYSPDGRLLASGGSDSTVKIWDVASARVVHTLLGHAEAVEQVVFSQDGQSLASGGRDGHVRVWNPNNGRLVYDVTRQDRVRGLAFVSPTLVVAGTRLEAADLIDLTTGKVVRSFATNNFTNRLATSADGQTLLVATDAGLDAWDVSTAKHLFNVKGFHAYATAFSRDGKVAVISNESTVRVVAMPSGKVLQTATTKEWVMDATVSPDGRSAVIAATTMQVLDIKTGKMRTTSAAVGGVVAQSADGRSIVTPESYSGAMTLLDATTGARLGTLMAQDQINAVAAGPDGLSFATGSMDGTVRSWTIGQGLNVSAVASPGDIWVLALALAPKGPPLLAASYVRNADPNKKNVGITLWDPLTKKIVRQIGTHASSLRFTPQGDGLWIGEVGAWRMDVATGKMGSKFEDKVGGGYTTVLGALALAASPDDKALAMINHSGGLTLWDTATHNQLFASGISGACTHTAAAAFSPDNKHLIANAGGLLDYSMEKKTVTKLSPSNFGICSRGIVFSPDGATFFTGGTTLDHRSKDATSFPVQAWNMTVSPPKDTWRFDGHKAVVTSLAVTPDGSRLLTGSEDGSARLLDSKTGTEMVRLLGMGTEDYLAVTPDGYYAGSKGALRQVAFRVGGKLFPFEQFDLQFNRPDLVLQRMGTVSPTLIEALHRAYTRRLQRMGFTEDRLSRDFHLPEIALVSAAPPATVKDKTLKLTVRASDSLYPLERLLVSVNDVPVYGSRGLALDKDKTSQKDLLVELSRGHNKIQLSSLNSRGVESLRETLHVTYDGPVTAPNLYVVAIGVSDYAGAEHDLTYAAKDAKDIATMFGGIKGTFGSVEVTQILDGEATREKILAARALLDKSRVDDTIVLFAAGHGLLDPETENFYFATADIDFNAPAQRGVAYDELEGLLDGVAARQKLMLVDACHSGEVEGSTQTTVAAVAGVTFRGLHKANAPAGKVGLDGSFALVRELFADLRRSSGAQVIASAGGGESAFESSSWKNGVFTYALLNGLQSASADRNKDGAIRVSELRQSVADEVQRLTSGMQKPVARRENLESDFVLWKGVAAKR